MPDNRPAPSPGTTENPSLPVSPDYQAIFDASRTPLLVISPPDWIIVAANEARLKATDTNREQNLGRKLFDVLPAWRRSFHSHGSSSCRLDTGRSAMRARMSASQTLGSPPASGGGRDVLAVT